LWEWLRNLSGKGAGVRMNKGHNALKEKRDIKRAGGEGENNPGDLKINLLKKTDDTTVSD